VAAGLTICGDRDVVNEKHGPKFLKVFFQPQSASVHLQLRDRIIYSYLAYALALDKRPNQTQISRWTGLHRSLVRRACGRLQEHGLLASGVIQPPPEGMFAARELGSTEPDHWWNRVAYLITYWPADEVGLDLFDTSIYSLCLTWPDRTFSNVYISKLLGIGHATTRLILERLQRVGLCQIEARPRGFSVSCTPVSAHPELFARNGTTAGAGEPRVKAMPKEAKFAEGGNDAYVYERCRASGIPVELSTKIVELARNKEIGFRRFDGLLDAARRENNPEKCPHPGLLLRFKLSEVADPEQPPMPDWPESCGKRIGQVGAKYGISQADAWRRLGSIWDCAKPRPEAAELFDDFLRRLLNAPVNNFTDAMSRVIEDLAGDGGG
jgi:hypothetical protein